jgi:putative phosphoesterase
MRLALVSDIHGNGVAFDAVLDDIATADVDEIVCLGDVATLGPQPGHALERLAESGARCVEGNHDAYLTQPGLVETYTKDPLVVSSVAWCRDQLDRHHLDFVAGFASELQIGLGHVSLLAVHGSPRSHTDDVLATTPPDELDRMLAGRAASHEVLASGHTHIQMLRQHGGTLVVNPGSVGMPFQHYTGGGPPELLRHAEYGILDARDGAVEVSLRRVPFDTDALVRAASACDIPLRDYLVGQYH